jgi:glycosyltransferase involved in cell wall biosynthesis
MNNTKTRDVEVSIIIPTYNHCDDLLKPCIQSIIKYTDLTNVEVIISANGCNDATRTYIDSLGEPFKLIWTNEPLGYTKAVNRGIKQSIGRYIVLLNNDCIILPQEKHEWIEMLLKPFKNNEKVGITGPLELFDNYSNAKVMIFFCVMIKRRLFYECGMLDEIYSPGGGEDIDFSIKSLNYGYLNVVVPNNDVGFTFTNTGGFPVFHKGEGTFTEAEFPEYSKTILKNNGLLNLKRYNKNIKLNIGSGGCEIDRYMSVDLFDRRAKIIADCTKLHEIFDENSVEEILASHLFEHLNPYHSHDILSGWYKILKKGGKLIMEMPDILQLCSNFEKSNKQERYGLLNCIYGSVNTATSDDPSKITASHLFGWFPEIMYDHLSGVGFTNIIFLPEKIKHPGFNFRVEATK